MKGCYCPNCGKKQDVRLEIQSRIIMPCHGCGMSLLIKREKDGIAIKAQGNPA